MRELPKGWVEATLPDVAEIIMGQSPPSSTYNSKKEGLPFFQGKAEFGSLYPSPVKYCKHPNKIAEAGDVLISVRAPVGPTNLCRERSCIGRGLSALRPKPLTTSQFILYSLRSIEDWLSKQGTGSTFTAISKNDIEEIEIALPPLPEQRRIVAKLEKLLHKVDSCKERLDKIPAILKRFRQSILSAACSGRLTTDWREKKPSGDETDDLPAGWKTVLSGDLFSFVTSGSRGWAKYYSDKGPLFIRIGNLDHDTIHLDLRSLQHVQPPKGTEGVRTRIQQNDVLISITADVGMIALVPAGFEEAYINQHIALARPVSGSSPGYLAWYLASSEGGLKQFQEMQRGATKVGLGLDDIKNVEVPLPPLPEQQEIVRRVEALFKKADDIEARYKKAKAFVDKLTQSILAKAFRGELVPQDPNDLPAPQPGKWYVYALECSNGSYYIGQTQDIEKRWCEHAGGRGADWTKRYPPIAMVHWEEFSSLEEAVEREQNLKTGFGRKWLKREIKAGRARQAGEPASVLLERIKAENNNKIKRGIASKKVRKG